MATSKAFITNENEWKVNGEVGADHAWTLEGITDGAGRVSAQIDLSARPQAVMFDLHVDIPMQATPTQYDGLHFYVAGAPDGTSGQIDGDVGATDAALGDLDQLKNLKYIGSVIAEEADTTDMKSSMSFMHTSRYLTLVMHNDSGATTNATDSNCVAYLIRRAWQGQAT
jgi:hypothetical protein